MITFILVIKYYNDDLHTFKTESLESALHIKELLSTNKAIRSIDIVRWSE